MQKIACRIVFFLFLLFYSFHSQSQNPNELKVDTTDIWNQSDDFFAKLPSVETFIDSAIARYPLLKINELNAKKRELEITKAKRNWTKDIIAGSADLNYGRFDNLIISKDLGLDQLNTSSGDQTRYSVGLSLKIPIVPLLDKTDIKMAKFNAEQGELEKEVLIKNIREEVFVKYNILIDCYQKYKILVGDFETYSILAQQEERKFSRNQTELSVLLNSKMNNSKAKMELISSKSNLEKAIWELKELTGIQIQF